VAQLPPLIGEPPIRPAGTNRLWMADLTYVSTWSGFAYVAFVTDAYARRILGWRVAATMTTAMVLDLHRTRHLDPSTRRDIRSQRSCAPHR
jgi:putative transposase